MKLQSKTKFNKRNITTSKIRQRCHEETFLTTYLEVWILPGLEPSGNQVLVEYDTSHFASCLTIFPANICLLKANKRTTKKGFKYVQVNNKVTRTTSMTHFFVGYESQNVPQKSGSLKSLVMLTYIYVLVCCYYN